MKLNEYGRSMIEMLGVLAIIGVMTVGGLNIIGRSRNMHEIGQLVSEVSKVAMTAKKMACQYDEEYGTYTMFLFKSEAYSDELEYENGAFTGPMDTQITITGDKSFFTVSTSNLSEDACIQLAGNNWGSKGTNGFLGVCVGNGECNPSSDAQMELNTASAACADSSVVKIKFKACYE